MVTRNFSSHLLFVYNLCIINSVCIDSVLGHNLIDKKEQNLAEIFLMLEQPRPDHVLRAKLA